ncbi:PDZ domain-containing protein [bacterium]|nr:PDZ domain-containing protein [bacterium]
MLIITTNSVAQLSVEIPEAAFDNGHSALDIPFTRMSDHIVLQVEIDGSREVDLIFDTGFGLPGVILFNRDIADSLKLTYTGKVDLGGGGKEGTKLANIATGVRLSLHGAAFADQQLLVLEDRENNFSGLAVDGIIGGTLMGSVVEIDYDKSAISLFDPASYKPDTGAVEFPIEFSSGIPVVKATLMLESGDVLPITLLYDTGVPEIPLLLFPFSSDRISMPDQTIEFRGEAMGGEMKIQCGRVRQLQLGPFSFEDVVGGYVTEEEFGTAVVLGQNGMLGHDIIQRFDAALDYVGKRIHMKPNLGFNRHYELNTAGLGLLKQKDGSFRVSCVVRNSPADEQGIKVGDAITSINDIKARDFGYLELREIFSHVDSIVSLKVSRKDDEFMCIVKLKRLI